MNIHRTKKGDLCSFAKVGKLHYLTKTRAGVTGTGLLMDAIYYLYTFLFFLGSVDLFQQLIGKKPEQKVWKDLLEMGLNIFSVIIIYYMINPSSSGGTFNTIAQKIPRVIFSCHNDQFYFPGISLALLAGFNLVPKIESKISFKEGWIYLYVVVVALVILAGAYFASSC